jgi:hypothetical protein
MTKLNPHLLVLSSIQQTILSAKQIFRVGEFNTHIPILKKITGNILFSDEKLPSLNDSTIFNEIKA